MLSNIKIRTLIIGAMALLLTLVAAMAALGFYGVQHVEAQFKGTALREAKTHQVMLRIKYMMEVDRSHVLQALQHNPAFDWSKLHDHPLNVHFDTIAQNSKALKGAWAQYVESIASPEERALAQAWFEKSGSLGNTSVEAAAAAVAVGKWDDAETILIKTINPAYRAGAAAAEDLSGYLKQRGVEESAAVARQLSLIRYLLAGAFCLAAGVACVVGAALIKGITVPLREAVRVARQVADGNLSTAIEVGSANELGTLLGALRDMNQSLSKVVGTVRASAERIATGASEIAGGNIDLSKRTEDQAASLQQTASSMDELSTTVESNAGSARQATALASAASDVAVKGGEVVGQVVATMGAIAASSKDRRHHRRDRRHRFPDQHPGLERGGRSRTRR